MDRVCLPTTKAYYDAVSSKVSSEKLETYFQDIKTAKYLILGSSLIAIVIRYKILLKNSLAFSSYFF